MSQHTPDATERPNRLQSAYPTLTQWPRLAPAVAVHLNMSVSSALRVPIKMMRKCGMYPERGVNVARYEDCILIRGGRRGGDFKQDEESKQFMLSSAGLNRAFVGGDVAIIEGPDYLVMTTRATALRLAANTPVIEKSAGKRMGQGVATVASENLDPADVTVLAWKDTKLCRSHNRRAAVVANVSGHLWNKSGFAIGDALRFTRYGNATVVEKCDGHSAHSTLSRSSHGTPRHYFGASLIDVQNTDCVRVIAAPGRLIVTHPETAIGVLCLEENHQPQPALKSVLAEQAADAVPLRTLLANEIGEIVCWRDYSVDNGRVTVSGRPWYRAGFELFEPTKLCLFDNALVFERCAEEEMDFRVGSKSQKSPYRNFGITRTALHGATTVRVISTLGRLVVTTPRSDVGRMCVKENGWNQAAQLAAFENCCFAMVDSGRLINKDAMPAGISHYTPLEYRRREQLRRLRAKTAQAAGNSQVSFRSRGRPSKLSVIAHSVPGEALTGEGLHVLGWKDVDLLYGRVVIAGAIWNAAGFKSDSPARVLFHRNALVIEPCDTADMDFQIGSPSRSAPYRNIGLNRFGFGHLPTIRIVATEGRLIITPTDSLVGQMCGADTAWPKSPEGVARRMATLRAQAEPEVSEVGSYTVPAPGRRLQMQGKWLGTFGFSPGAKFKVVAHEGELHVLLCAENGWTVTEHSPGTSKLYVPAQSLELLNTDKVRVFGREGVLKLIPL